MQNLLIPINYGPDCTEHSIDLVGLKFESHHIDKIKAALLFLSENPHFEKITMPFSSKEEYISKNYNRHRILNYQDFVPIISPSGQFYWTQLNFSDGSLIVPNLLYNNIYFHSHIRTSSFLKNTIILTQ